jgi:hypothetical protein
MDILVADVRLPRPGVMASIGQRKIAGVPEYVWVRL